MFFVLALTFIRPVLRTALLLAGAALLPLSLSAVEPSFAIRAGRVHLGTGVVLDQATIIVERGKIVAVGKDIARPDGIPFHDLQNHVIIPGLVDAETSLTGESSDVEKSISPEIRAADGWDFFADRRVLLRGGITTVYVAPGISYAPGRSTRLVSGHGCVVKMAGHVHNPQARMVRPNAGLQVTLGELSKRPPSLYDPPLAASPDNPFVTIPIQSPHSRPGELRELRRLFDDGRKLWRGPDGGTGEFTSGLTLLEASNVLPVLKGDDVLRVRANRARDILQVLRFAREQGLKMVLEGGREADLLVSELVESGVPVVFPGGFQPGVLAAGDLATTSSEGRYQESTMVALVAAGVTVVIHSPTDADAGQLLDQAASAVRAGVPSSYALKSITSLAAEVLGVGDRVGSIAPGRDADLVILGGEPFSTEGRVQAVFCGGELVYHAGPQDLGPETTVVRARRVHDGKGETIAGGIVVTEGRKIRYVGPGPLTAQLSPRARVIDAREEVIVPGFIDTGTSAGTRVEARVLEALATSGASGASGRSTLRLADAIDPGDPSLLEIVRNGITTVAVTPEPTAAVSGQVSVWKLSGGSREEVTLRVFAGLLLRPDLPPPELKRAKEYHDRWTAYEAKSEGEAPEKRDELEPFRKLFEKKATAFVYSDVAASAVPFVRGLSTDYGMNVVVLGDARVDRATAELRNTSAAVLLSVPFVVNVDFARINVPQATAAAGLRFAFRSGVATGAGQLVPQIAHAVAAGLDGKAALMALTSRAAEILGVDDRVGSLEEDKDADLVFLSDEPFTPSARVVRVMVEGKMQ